MMVFSLGSENSAINQGWQGIISTRVVPTFFFPIKTGSPSVGPRTALQISGYLTMTIG